MADAEQSNRLGARFGSALARALADPVTDQAEVLALASLAVAHGGDEDHAIAAVLAGVAPADEIAAVYGERAARLATADDPADAAPEELLMVGVRELHRVAGLIDRQRVLGDEAFAAAREDRAQVLARSQAVAEAVAAALPGSLADELRDAVDALAGQATETGTAEAFASAVAVEARRQRSRARRRTAVVAGALIGVAALAGLAFSVRVALFPNADDPRPVDAVVVLGGTGNRIERGLELVRAGWAPILVVSQPQPDGVAFDYLPICQNPPSDVEVRCEDPPFGTTRGEARMISELSFRNGWDQIMVVAADEQVNRARLLIRRCYPEPNDLVMVASDRSQPLPMAVAYEGAATVRALVFRTRC